MKFFRQKILIIIIRLWRINLICYTVPRWRGFALIFCPALAGYLISHITTAQQYNFKSLSVEHGLAQSQVFVIYEDHRGNLWIGTDGGLSKYNGYSFTNYTTKDGLVNNRVRAIYQDNDNNLWIGTLGGLTKYDPAKMGQVGNKFTKYDASAESGLPSNFITTIYQDTSDILWIGTNKGLCQYGPDKSGQVGKNFIPFNPPQTNKLNNIPITSIVRDDYGNFWFSTLGNGVVRQISGDWKDFKIYSKSNSALSSNRIIKIFKDKKGRLWFIPEDKGGICYFDGNKIINFSVRHNLPTHVFTSITQDLKGNIWVGTSGSGVIKFDPEKPKEMGEKFAYFDEKSGLASNYVNTIIVDRTGNIWFGTDGGGISKFDSEQFLHFTEKIGLPNDVVMAIVEDSRGNFWFGTYGGGTSLYDGNKFYTFNKKNGLCSDIIVAIIEDNNGNLWFGSRDAGVSTFDGKTFHNYSTKNGLVSNKVYAIIQDFDGNIWIGTEGGVNCYDGKKFTKFTTAEGLSANEINSLFQDSKGNIWIGTDYGVNKLVSQNNNIQIFKYTINDSLANNYVFSISEDKKGNIWFGTFGGGLSKYNNKNFHNYSTENGLTSDNIYFIIFDDDDNLWAGSEKGIDKIIIKNDSLIVKHYGIAEGLIGLETNLNAVFKDSKGCLWFGTIQGVTKYDKTVDIPNTIEPLTYIENIQLFHKDVDWKKFCKTLDKFTGLPVNLVLPRKKNYLTFNFIGINLKNPEKVKYSWLLEGFDDEWCSPTTKHEAIYSYLPPGRYTFKVKATNGEGVWNKEPVTFSFRIKPPFWLKWWFLIFTGGAAFTLVYTIISRGYKIRISTLRTEAERLERKVKERTKDIQKLSVAIRETGNSVVITDPNGKIEWVNEGFEKLYGYKFKQFINEFGDDIRKISHHRDIEGIIKYSIDRKETVTYSSFWEKQKKWIQTSVTPIFEGDDLLNLVFVEADITPIKEAEEKIKEEKEKSEKLLLNILPAEIADELKTKGMALPRFYPFVSMMFIDFVNFTLISEKLPPEELVETLGSYFVKFDEIIEKHYLEKIKTSGDAYMCAGGVPIRNKSNPFNIVLAALEINEFMINSQKNASKDKPQWNVRIGIHTGSVIGGVIGKKKFVFDIWGDSVNTTSRIESSGAPGKINISGQTYEHIKDYFVCEYRGKISAKHKGEIDMYFVNRIKPEFSTDDKGIIPNDKFCMILSQL